MTNPNGAATGGEKTATQVIDEQRAVITQLREAVRVLADAGKEVIEAFKTTYYLRDNHPPHPDDHAELRRRAALKQLQSHLAALDAVKGDKE